MEVQAISRYVATARATVLTTGNGRDEFIKPPRERKRGVCGSVCVCRECDGIGLLSLEVCRVFFLLGFSGGTVLCRYEQYSTVPCVGGGNGMAVGIVGYNKSRSSQGVVGEERVGIINNHHSQ